MDPDRDMDSIDEILKSVAEGAAVNWNAAIRDAGGAEKRRVEDLRQVARIAEFHRELVHRAEGAQGATGSAPVPEKWGELLVLERIGSGGQADVFRAWDSLLQRDVALKLLHETPRREASTATEPSALVQEGRALARVQHPHVVAVHGIDVRDGRVGLWMELVKGTSLEREVQAHGALAPETAARLGTEIGSALAAVHAAGLVHRDVKPANVVKDAGGRFVLADFGLGLRTDDAALGAARPSGTPLYMAPELFSGAPPSPRTDIYALGLLLGYALTGRHAFEAQTYAELREKVAHGARPKLGEVRAGLDAGLATIVERAAAHDPAARFASAGDLVEALRAWAGARNEMGRAGALRDDGTVAAAAASRNTARSRWPIFAALAGVAALVAIVMMQSSRTPDTRVSSATAPVPGAGVPIPAPSGMPATPGEAGAPPMPSHADAGAAQAPYSVDASFLLRRSGQAVRLVSGDPVAPGDRLSLEMRITRPAYVYVLNEDDRGECYLLFPQPMFDVRNPLPADVDQVLPGPIEGRENAWTVTSRGGREHFLVVVSPEPVAELEADLARIAAPTPGKPIEYASVPGASVERLRGMGGIDALPAEAASPSSRSQVFQHFRALAGREDAVRGVWVRHVVLENPAK